MQSENDQKSLQVIGQEQSARVFSSCYMQGLMQCFVHNTCGKYLRAAAPAADPGTHQGGGVLQLALAKKLWFR